MTYELRQCTSAILVSTDGRLLLQLRDNVPDISDPGKISLFGGQREAFESFLECVVREVYEEIGWYIPPERFELIGSYSGADPLTPNGRLHCEVYASTEVPTDALTITEGTLRIVAMDELATVQDLLSTPAKYALGIFLNPDRRS